MSQLICTKTCGTCRKAVALLKEKDIEFEYREYKKDPLSLEELEELLELLGEPAHTLLRRRETIYKELNLQGDENNEISLPLFVQYPGLMQRPIFVHEGAAVLCRPHDRLLELL